ncbi:histidine phosphatase family protein [Microbacterium gorillae]|uniref:histidine phosphatase family protein n=1 Tax=Microbacterium gorillae TaxID=1231063 RepID=UPI000694F017|nr:histidine phosphatase family protein [Microbacterium gorillae]
MGTLHLARHGETIWHAENRYAGVSDIGLTKLGHEQARDLAKWAVRVGISAVVSSDLSRARETAQPAATALGVELVVDPRLRELDFGQAEGMTPTEMTAHFGAARAAFEMAPATSPLPGGELGEHAVDRALPALEELAHVYDGDVLVVTHATLLRMLLCRILAEPLDRYRNFFPVVGNATITTLGYGDEEHGGEDGGLALLRYNAPTAW